MSDSILAMATSRSRIAREIGETLGLRGSRRAVLRHWRGSRVQSILFDVATWTPAEAARWARSHDYRSDDVHVTEQYVRLRQRDPDPGKPKRTIDFGRGIRAVVEAR